MEFNQCKDSFIQLGEFLRNYSDGNLDSEFSAKLNNIVLNDHILNPWFTEQNIKYAISAIGGSLIPEKLEKWVSKYADLEERKVKKNVGVITAGNIPLVGFHDFLTVLISGNKFVGKLSTKDNRLLKFIADYLINLNEDFTNLIEFTEDKLENFDAVIATGSNNTSRYFEYYFGKYPHIIRKNRNSIAILEGMETKEELRALGNDLFNYFGLGCRNVSKIFFPSHYTFDTFFENLQEFFPIYNHNKYANNYDYNKSIYLMNQIQHFDNGFVILKEDEGLSSPIGVIYFQYYDDIDNVKEYIRLNRDQIQCVVSKPNLIENNVPFGKAQQPELWDYADNIDTIEFLLRL